MRDDRLADIIAAHHNREGALLPILNDVQAAFGCVDEDTVRALAAALNLSRAEVHGVVSFYHDYKAKADPRPVLKLCRAEACQAMGCQRLEQRLHEVHGTAMGATSADGALTVEPVYCLGNCALSPAAMVDDELVGRADLGRIETLVHEAAQ